MPAPGAPLFQAATANLNPWTEARVDTKNPHRGPLLIISGEKDHTVPWAVANASYKKQAHNPGVTEIVEMPNRGHALTIDNGWREVADTALTFVQRFVRRAAAAASIRADPRQSRVSRRRRPAERRDSNRLASVSARVHRRRSTLGTIVVAAVALTHGLATMAIVVAAMFIYQQVENHTLQPLVYHRTVQLSPLAIAVTVAAGAELGGVIGALLGIPAAGAIKVVTRELVAWRRGQDAPPAGPRPRRRAAANELRGRTQERL